MTTYQIRPIADEADYPACFAILRVLRPHLADVDDFIAQLRRQQGQGYGLMGVFEGAAIQGLAGYRIQENFLYGRFMYVDDLVVQAPARRNGAGGLLLDALRREALRQACRMFVLDTSLDNSLAQRFYFRHGLLARGLHFSQPLQDTVCCH